MRSQRIALVGAFCGGILAGAIAAAWSDLGPWGTTENEVPRQAIPMASLAGSGAGGIHDGDAALKAKVVSAAVAGVGLSTEQVARRAIVPRTAPSPVQGFGDEPAVDIAKAGAPVVAPSTAPTPAESVADAPAVEIAKAAAPVVVPSVAPSPAEVVVEPAVEIEKAAAPVVAPGMAPTPAESAAEEREVKIATAAAPTIAPGMAPGPARGVVDETAVEIAKVPAIAPSMAPSSAERVADETVVEIAKAAAWESTRMASLHPGASAGKADWERSADDFDTARRALVPDHPEDPTDELLLAMALAYGPADEDLKTRRRRTETPDECLVAEICMDDYLWSLYEVTPKLDTNKETARVKVTVTKKGKTRTIVRTITKYVPADFTWKDPIAARRGGMSLKDYVIGGMDRSFRIKLANALRAMEAAGFMPGITSAFRDDYRQSIASGKKAASDSSYHGGSRRGGYGHGLAADLVSVKGDTRLERFVASKELWKWIDEHEKELGIGRPYLDRDPPHVAPLDGKEYADKRGGRARIVGSAKSHRRVVAAKIKTS